MAKKFFTDENLATFVEEIKAHVQEQIAAIPVSYIYNGTVVPTSDIGANGDIYIVTEEP